jgi:hypothetical protein
MAPSVEKQAWAWQPLTPRGVATFARASLGRLLLVQLIVALLAAAVTVWFLLTAWFPAITEAIRRLPDQGEIRRGTLIWRGDSPQLLAEGRFLAFAVDLNHAGTARSPAHIQVEFGQTDVKIFSLFGFVARKYPSGWTVAFNRTELEPHWGAWAPEVLALSAAAVIAGLLTTWALLATSYCLPAWLTAFYADRDLSWGGSWRLAGASLMPGALFLLVVVVLYGLAALDLIHLLLGVAGHLLIGWVYLFVSVCRLPSHPAGAPAAGNPFIEPKSPQPPSP